jgi:hypothetical protein
MSGPFGSPEMFIDEASRAIVSTTTDHRPPAAASHERLE